MTISNLYQNVQQFIPGEQGQITARYKLSIVSGDAAEPGFCRLKCFTYLLKSIIIIIK